MKNVNVWQDGFFFYLLLIRFLLYVIHYMKPSATFNSVVARRALPLPVSLKLLYIKALALHLSEYIPWTATLKGRPTAALNFLCVKL